MQKASAIRQRRKESAARSRARKAEHFHDLEESNRLLREENQQLKMVLSALESRIISNQAFNSV